MLLERASHIYKKISHAAMRAGRDPGEVRLVAVTKTVSIEAIREAIEGGLRIFGENRVQEAQKKIASPELNVPGSDLEWHLIGHLQRNKARQAVQLFELIQTLDSVALAEDMDRQAERAGKLQRVLVEVKLSEEETKQGVSEEGLVSLVERIGSLGNLKLEGLMTMPPFFEEPEMARPYFRRLREIRDAMEKRGFPLRELSMGMSHDFEVAVEEGATLVRIGTALFGERRI